jgi:hypothetical protein
MRAERWELPSETKRARRQGQITPFVILGLAVLLIVGLVLLRPASHEATSLTAQQDQQLITNTVQQCLAQAGEQSVRAVAQANGRYSHPAQEN